MFRKRGSNTVCGHLDIACYGHGMCVTCYQQAPEQKLRRSKYRKTPKCKVTKRNYGKSLRVRAVNLVQHAVASTKKRTQKGRSMCDVEIDTDWVIDQLKHQDHKCFWSGQPIKWDDEPYSPWQISLDRRDPTLGYSKINTVLTAWCINRFRGSMSESQTLEALKQLFWSKS